MVSPFALSQQQQQQQGKQQTINSSPLNKAARPVSLQLFCRYYCSSALYTAKQYIDEDVHIIAIDVVRSTLMHPAVLSYNIV